MGELLRRLRFLFRRGRFDRDLEEEMRLHLEMQAEANREAGMDAEEARYAAQRRQGRSTGGPASGIGQLTPFPVCSAIRAAPLAGC
jgi:hypothetical protein